MTAQAGKVTLVTEILQELPLQEVQLQVYQVVQRLHQVLLQVHWS